MKKMIINANVGMMSCAGISGKFPYTWGNYCSNVDGIYFVNLWAENLQHMLINNILADGKVEVILFEENGCKYAYAIDERIPEEAIHAPYFCGIKTCLAVLRYHSQVPDDKCVCDYGHTNTSSTNAKGLVTSICPECRTVFTVQKARKGCFRLLIKLTEDDPGGWPYSKWVLAWYEDGVFSEIPSANVIDHSEIIKVDVNRVNEFGGIEDQQGAIAVDDFIFEGVVSKTPPEITE